MVLCALLVLSVGNYVGAHKVAPRIGHLQAAKSCHSSSGSKVCVLKLSVKEVRFCFVTDL